MVGSTCYQTLADAYNAITAGPATILVRGISLSESFTANRPFPVTIQGGYDDSFTSQSGVTTLSGTMTISAGTIILDRFALR